MSHTKSFKKSANEQLGSKLEQTERLTLQDLLDIMQALRTPGTGCPWDLEQTFRSIVPYTLEEAYEVADAIENKSMDELKGELGDLLFQVVYYAQMAKEDGMFDFADVCDVVSRKMIRRHPHVFGNEQLRRSVDVKGLWERLKSEEKSAADADGVEVQRGLLDDIPVALPALQRAEKLQNRAAKAGFNWPSLAPVLAKLDEEIGELKEVAQTRSIDKLRVEEELGDVLFVLANVARHMGVDAEQALRGANAKMVRRFSYIEKRLAQAGRTVHDASLDEMDCLWDEAKRLEKD